MNAYFKDMLNPGNVTDYKAWSDIYATYVGAQVKVTHKQKQVYNSGNTWRLICKRNEEEQVMNAEDGDELNKRLSAPPEQTSELGIGNGSSAT